MGAFDAFLKIDGIAGESQDSNHKDEIELLSYSFGLQNSAAGGGGGGGGAGKVQFQDFHFVTQTQKSTPALFLACASGEHFKKAVLTVRKSGSDQQEYYKVSMEDILVTGFAQAGDDSGETGVPMDQVSINFAKIELQIREQDAKGSLGDTFSASWDLKKGRGG